MMIRSTLLLSAALLTGCAGMNDAMTPSVNTIKDDFDGRMIVRQASVNAASSLSEAFHTLGFEWNEKYPDLIFITAGIALRTQAIEGVAFNADNVLYKKLKPASALTDFRNQASYRRFEISLTDFIRIANARVVKMRLEGINDYTVSSFGPGTSAIVNLKFGPFLQQVNAIRSKGRPG